MFVSFRKMGMEAQLLIRPSTAVLGGRLVPIAGRWVPAGEKGSVSLSVQLAEQACVFATQVGFDNELRAPLQCAAQGLTATPSRHLLMIARPEDFWHGHTSEDSRFGVLGTLEQVVYKGLMGK